MLRCQVLSKALWTSDDGEEGELDWGSERQARAFIALVPRLIGMRERV
jgi:hypothetical protein